MLDFVEIIDSSKLKTFQKNFAGGVSQTIIGLNSLAEGLLIGVVGKGGVLIAKDLVSSGKIAQMLSAFNFNVKFLTSPFENSFGLTDFNLKNEFFTIINDFVRGKVDFIIALSDVLFQKIPSKKSLLENAFWVKEKSEIELTVFIKKLAELGLERVDYITARGQFSVKGDTVQIFLGNSENLIRIEFFGSEVEKISEISYEEKKFVKKLQQFEILAISTPLEDVNILSLTNKVFFDEPKQIEEQIKNFAWAENFISQQNVYNSNAKSQVAFANLSSKTFFKYNDIISFQMLASKNYIYNFKELLTDLMFYKNSGKEVYLFCKNQRNKEMLSGFLQDNFIFTETVDGKKSFINLTTDYLPYSANFVDGQAIIIGTYDLFKKEKPKIKNKKSTFFTPKINEYVVHEIHGIGKCVGIEKLNFSGFDKDYIIIEYAGGDRFYCPSEQADSLSAYYTSDTSPKLNKLGGLEFARIKEKIYNNVKKLAFDLLELYAKREKAVGNIYVKDDYLMEQFENAFPFTETPDQLRAISEVKADMEGNKVMDRLVCGDVGFGKTEVALRAIYKAVLSGKQVAFLCPTTILAEQHYHTCLKRFNGFMVKVARFNRLMPKPEERDVLAGLKSGDINVVCGTHKLLSKNVDFNNLTLLVLDEEQRFGVEDKEKIKNIKNNVDVLSLSATPIPRTLHMSLSGIRDISIIDTPPKERQPIQTFVTEYDEDLIMRACKQELARNGQILIIYNRIDTIYDFAKKIQQLLPEAQIGVAHGRLSQKNLEDSIMKLYAGEYQILVSTTLIENGIDIPTANTLIVIDADKLGLSQAHQIRGRIGRSNRIAYAYFLFKQNKQLTESAYQRLSALVENTALGSGFKIAMADLDIRGAGNVLGREQHGNMVKVGYDLYYKLLTNAIKEIKGEKLASTREVRLDIQIDAYIPQTFIPLEEERLKAISQISEINSDETVQEVSANLFLVYGSLPDEVENLMTLALIKNLSKKLGVRRILISSNACHIYFYENKDIILNEFATIKEKIKDVLIFLKSQIT